MTVITRIAPSPTGRMHIGTVRTALFNYLFAKHHQGKYFVRIEDTDRERNKDEWTQDIWKDFDWCGLTPDERYVQSEHLAHHRDLLHELVGKGLAYISKEPARDDPSREVEVVRLKNPGTSVSFDDMIRGTVTFDTAELGDFVIARSIDDPLYHFAVVVDDGDAGVTHVIRAEEHISNTPRQILIQEALGLPRPTYAHIPLILAPDRSKLSKRKHSASIDNFRAQGYLPEALINYLALLGWTPASGREILSLDEMITEFDLASVHKSGAIFDIEKLKWVNRQYLLAMPEAEFAAAAMAVLADALADRVTWDEHIGRLVTPILKERLSVWHDIRTAAAEGEYDFYFKAPTLEPDAIPNKDSSKQDARGHLMKASEMLSALSDADFTDSERIKTALWDYATEVGRGNILWPLRFTLSGRKKSPDPFVIASVIGKQESLARITNACAQLV